MVLQENLQPATADNKAAAQKGRTDSRSEVAGAALDGRQENFSSYPQEI
jgi:hypothetical protein